MIRFAAAFFSCRFWIATAGSFALAAGAYASDQLVLGAANNSGRQTRVSVTNRASSPAQVSLRFVAADPSVSTTPATITLLPMATMVYADVLQEVWSLSGEQGAVRVTSSNSLAITAGKYILSDDGGRVGSPLPVLYASDLVAPGAIGDLLWISQSADATTGLSSSIEVYTDTPGTRASLVIFDAAGNQIASTAINGGPMISEIPVSSLAPNGLATARAELRVSAGGATASLEVTDNTSGRWATASILNTGSDGQDLVIATAFHFSTLGASQLQTDVRLFNENQTAVTITAQYGTLAYTGSIPPMTIAETTDILSSWFGVSDSEQGLVTIHATAPVLGVQRTLASSMAPDTTGQFFSLEAVPLTQPALTEGLTGVIGGLRGPGAQIALSGRAGASGDLQANLTLRDTTGQIMAQTSLVIPQAQSQLQAIGDLFAGVTVPDDGILELTAVSGDLDAAVFSVDANTGDVDYIPALTSGVDSACALPQILSAAASAQNLSQPGNVTFNWNTRLASSIVLQPVATNLDPSSTSYTTPVSSSTVFQLVASNACGTATASISVSVGTPAVTSISVSAAPSGSTSGSGAGGQPGQIVTLNLNLGDPSVVSGLVLRQGTAIEMALPLLGFTPNGSPYARIPLLPDSTATGGYHTGAFTVTAVVNGKETAAVPLTIQPLPAVADPVGALLALLDGISAAGKQSAASLQGLAGATAVQAAMTTASLLETDLRQMLSSISSSGQATLPQGLRLQASTSTPSVTVSKNDLAAIVALNVNYLSSATPANPAPAASATSGTCLDQKQPYLPVCRNLEAALQKLWQVTDPYPQVYNEPDLDAAFQKSQTAGVAYIAQRLQSSSMQGVLRKINLWTNWLSLLCVLEPIRLEGLNLVPSQFAVGYPNGTVTATKVNAILQTKYQGQTLADALANAETQKLLSQLPQKYNLQQFPIGQGATPAVQTLYGDMSTALMSYVQKYAAGVPSQMTYQVGQCDIASLYAQSNGAQQNQYDPSAAILIPVYADDPSWGRDTYYFEAARSGQETMCVQLAANHFLLSQDLQTGLQQPTVPAGQVCGVGPAYFTPRSTSRPRGIFVQGPSNGVIVVGLRLDMGLPIFFVTNYEVNAWCQCPDENPTGVTSPGINFSGNVVAVGPYIILQSMSHRQANASLRVNQVAPSYVWEATLDMTTAVQPGNAQMSSAIYQGLVRATMRFVNPVNRYKTQAIAVKVTPVDQTCQRPFAYTGSFTGTAGSVTDNRPAKNPAVGFTQVYSGATSGQLTLTLGGEADGFNIQTGECKFTADITLGYSN